MKGINYTHTHTHTHTHTPRTTQGTEVKQMRNSDPGMLIGKHAFSSVEFNGTFFVNTEIDDDYAGIVFNYQSNKRFMLVAWKQSNQSYWQRSPFSAYATAGVQIKVVQSDTGPGPMLRNAIWHSRDTPREVRSPWKLHAACLRV